MGITSTEKIYHNKRVFAPDGKIHMFNINERKLNFYLKKDLIEQIDDTKYVLKFTPNGLGLSTSVRESGYIFGDLYDRENICVVSGEEKMTKLTKHHIVPTFFRQHIPIEFKRNYQIVVLIEEKLHKKYTKQEQEFYNTLSKYYGIETFKESEKTFFENILHPLSVTRTLLRHEEKIPEDKVKELKFDFEVKFKIKATKTNYEKVLKEYSYFKGVNRDSGDFKKIVKRFPEFDYAQKMISKIKDFQFFEYLWITHFLETMKPKFLPKDLESLYLKLQEKYGVIDLNNLINNG